MRGRSTWRAGGRTKFQHFLMDEPFFLALGDKFLRVLLSSNLGFPSFLAPPWGMADGYWGWGEKSG